MPEKNAENADTAAIRRRVLAALQGAGGEDQRRLSSAPPGLSAEQTELDDPAVASHMEAARRRLAVSEKKMAALPEREGLRTKYLLEVRRINGAIRSLKAAAERLDEIAAAADCPRGVRADLEGLKKGVHAVHAEIFVHRRELELVGDGLLRLVDEERQNRMALKEYVAASAEEHRRKAGGPAEALGERLLASPALAEDAGIADSKV